MKTNSQPGCEGFPSSEGQQWLAKAVLRPVMDEVILAASPDLGHLLCQTACPYLPLWPSGESAALNGLCASKSLLSNPFKFSPNT